MQGNYHFHLGKLFENKRVIGSIVWVIVTIGFVILIFGIRIAFFKVTEITERPDGTKTIKVMKKADLPKKSERND